MMWRPMILLMSVQMSGSLAIDWSDRHYRTDKGVVCEKCPPGHHVVADCIGLKNQMSDCRPCPQSQYQDEYTESKLCVRCRDVCPQRAEFVKNCTSTSNAVCQCMEGFYRQDENKEHYVCLKYDDCKVGYGVSYQGDHENNTTCKICEPGYYSDVVSNKDFCKPCSDCPEGSRQKNMCTSSSDTQCENIPGDNTALIAGVVSGVVVVVIIVIIVLVVCVRRGCVKNRFKSCNKGDTKEMQQLAPNGKPHTVTSDQVDCKGQFPSAESVDNSSGSSDNDQLPPKLMSTLAKDLISFEWQNFFRFLMIPDVDGEIVRVVADNPYNITEQIYQMLLVWKQCQGKDATVKKLVDVLKELEKTDLVEKYTKYIAEEPSEVQVRSPSAPAEDQQPLVGQRNGVTSNGSAH